MKDFLIKWALISVTVVAAVKAIPASHEINHKITLEGNGMNKRIEFVVNPY